jgi:hypothetical protein
MREEDRKEAKEALTAKLLMGLGSGKPIPFTDRYFQRKRNILARKANRMIRQAHPHGAD